MVGPCSTNEPPPGSPCLRPRATSCHRPDLEGPPGRHGHDAGRCPRAGSAKVLADIHGIDALLGCMEVDLGLPLGSTMVYPILETAQALRLAYDIALASTA